MARSGDALAETFSTLDLSTWHPNPTEEARALWESAFVNSTHLVVDGGWSIW